MLKKLFRRRPLIEELEPRILFSADLVPLAIDGLSPAPEQRVLTADGEFSNMAATTRNELVIVDAGVQDYQTLLDDILKQSGSDRHIDVVVLDASRDGIEQITEVLQQRGKFDALHLITHGESGKLKLGNTQLDSASLDTHAADIAAWGAAFNANADLLLYGCDVAAGVKGEAFVQRLAALTHADVAASDDLTGSAAQGGDWALEDQTGAVETSLILGPVHTAWQGVLDITAAPGQTLVNGTLGNDQLTTPSSRQVAINPTDGSFVVVWTSGGGQDGNGNGVFLRQFNADGTPRTGEIKVNTTTAKNQQNPAIAMDGSGNFVVVWESQDQDGNGYGIYAQRFNANATTNGSEMQVNTTTNKDQTSPSVAMSTTGSFVVAWTSKDEDGDGLGVYARQFSDATATWGSAFRVNGTTANDQFDPAVAMNKATGDFVIVWTSSRQDGSGDGVYGRLFNAAGGTVKSEFRINLNTNGDQKMADAAMNSSGAFVVVMADNSASLLFPLFPSLRTGVYANVFDNAGTAQYSNVLVNQYSDKDQRNPAVALEDSGDFIVTWESDGQDGNGYGIVARHFKANAAPYQNEQLINVYTAGDQSAPSVAWNGSQAVFLWSGQDAVDSKGVSFRLASVASGVNTQPVITSDGGFSTAAVCIAENTTAVTTVTATDANLPAQTLSYSIVPVASGGAADAAKFAINPATGVLSFIAAPDFESPTDAGADNVYDLTVQVSDGAGGITTQTIAVTVTDVGGPLTVDTTSDTVDGTVTSIEALLGNRGTDGKISLREAIIATNNTAGADTIDLPAGTYTLTIAGAVEDFSLTGDLDVRDSLTINGAGAASTVISGGGTISLLQIVSGNASISGLTFRDGFSAFDGAGIGVDAGATLNLSQSIVSNNVGNASGAGIYNNGTLTLTDVEVSNNLASSDGGSIYHTGTSLTLDRVTLDGNTAWRGGGLYSSGAATSLKNVTVSGNTAGKYGGGIYTAAGTIALTNVTVAYNSAGTGGGGLYNSFGAYTLKNTIVANNAAPSGLDISGTFGTAGHNLFGDASVTSGQASDQIGVNPLLDPVLKNNGGATRTHALLNGSAAINAGSAVGAPVTDQRGFARAGATDIGAYEYIAANNAPVLDASKTPTLAAQNEDSGAPVGTVGTLVSSLVDFPGSGGLDNVTDPDAGALLGIAVTAADTTHGSWFYTTDNGSTWNALGAVSDDSALLLAADASTRLYFRPSADWNGTLANAITFRAWDQTSGTNGGTAVVGKTVLDTFSNVSYGNNDGTTTWAGNWVGNDSSGGGPSGGNIWVDGGTLDIRAESTGDRIYRQVNLSGAVSATLSLNYDNNLSGSDRILLQVSNNGGSSYVDLPGVAFSSTENSGIGSLSLDLTPYISAATRIRFYVDSSGANDHLYLDNVQIAYTTPGISSAFSTTTEAVSLTLNPVNDAPSGTDGTITINEDAPYTFQTSDFGFSDTGDSPADSLLTVKIVTLPSAGTLLYEGSPVVAGQVIGAADIALNELQCVPAADASGVGYASFAFQVQDSGGTANGGIDLDPTPRTLTIDVNPLNDAPTATGTAFLAAIQEDDTAPSGATVADLFAANFSNAEDDGTPSPNQFAGVAVRGQSVNPAQGRWQYSTDNGASWSNFGFISDANAVSLGLNDRLRFLPAADYNGAPNKLSVRLLDDSIAVTSGGSIDVSVNGGTSAASSRRVRLATDITPVNDAPAASPVDLGSINEDGSLLITQANLLAGASDVDGDTLAAVNLALTTGNGTLSNNGDGTWTFTPTADWSGSVAFSFAVSDGTVTIANTASLKVSPVNDAPVITSTATPSVDEDKAASVMLTATDTEGGTLTYAISGGADAALFTIVPETGELRLKAVPNYEAPLDANRDNIYEVRVTVIDGNGGISNQTINLKIINVIEPASTSTGPAPDTNPGNNDETKTGGQTHTVPSEPLPNTPADTGAQKEPASVIEEVVGAISDGVGNAALKPVQIIFNDLARNTEETTADSLLASLSKSLGALSSDSMAMETLQTSLSNSNFQQQLNKLQDQIRQQLTLDHNTVASTFAVSTGLSVGYVLWLVRGGVLLSSLLSTMPAWRMIDPLPILGHLNNRKNKGEDDESLEGMLKKSNAKAKTPADPSPPDGNTP